MTIAERVYALIFNGITHASSSATDRHDGWLPLSERERFAEAVYAELRAGNIEFRLGPLALLAEAAEIEQNREMRQSMNVPTCLGRDMDCGRALPCPDHGEAKP